MAMRFSQIWSLPPRAPSPVGDDNTSKASSRRRRTRAYLRKVYRLLSNIKTRPSDLETAEEFSTASAPSILETLLGPAIQVPLPTDQSPHVAITGIKRPRAAFRDSGISDISLPTSLESLNPSDASTNLKSLPSSSLPCLEQHLRKETRCLLKQEHLTSQFSTNLVHLFAKKERNIEINKRLSDDMKEVIIVSITQLRRVVGQTMLKKAVYCQRDLGILRELGELVMRCREQERGEVSLENVQRVLKMLRDDAQVQKQLDQTLRTAVVQACLDKRVGRSEGEKISLKRFVRFVESRLGALTEAYARLEALIAALEGSLPSLLCEDKKEGT